MRAAGPDGGDCLLSNGLYNACRVNFMSSKAKLPIPGSPVSICIMVTTPRSLGNILRDIVYLMNVPLPMCLSCHCTTLPRRSRHVCRYRNRYLGAGNNGGEFVLPLISYCTMAHVACDNIRLNSRFCLDGRSSMEPPARTELKAFLNMLLQSFPRQLLSRMRWRSF